MTQENYLNPQIDLSTPAIDALISEAGFDGWQVRFDTASEELARLHAVIKAQREQMERTNKAMVEYARRDKELVDKLCDIRDTLKPYMVAYSEWASMPEAAIRTVLSKNFSVAIPE